MNVFELAKKYYPDCWDKARIDMLYKFGKLTEEDYNEVLNKSGE